MADLDTGTNAGADGQSADMNAMIRGTAGDDAAKAAADAKAAAEAKAAEDAKAAKAAADAESAAKAAADAAKAVDEAKAAKAAADDAGAKGEKLTKAQARVEERIAAAEKRAEEAEHRAKEMQEMVQRIAADQARREAEAQADALEKQIAGLVADMERTKSQAAGLLTPEEAEARARAKADSAAAEARKKAEGKASELSEALKLAETTRAKEIDDLRKQVTDLQKALQEREELVARESQESRENSAIAALLSNGLRADAEELARTTLARVLDEASDLKSADGRAKFVASYKERYPLLFGAEQQTSAGVGAGQRVSSTGTGTNMNQLIRGMAGRR
jgi:hypothetical protein